VTTTSFRTETTSESSSTGSVVLPRDGESILEKARTYYSCIVSILKRMKPPNSVIITRKTLSLLSFISVSSFCFVHFLFCSVAFEDKCCEPMSNGKPDNHSYRAAFKVTLGSLKLFVRGEVDAVTHLKQEEDPADSFSKLSLSSEPPSRVPINWEGSSVAFLKTTESLPHQLEEVKTSRLKSFQNTMKWWVPCHSYFFAY
jgi:hypothetical protein